MQLTASEQATLHFYEWEYLGRGYYHFDDVVMIEPPFRPFYHKSFNAIEQKDDGRVPSVFSRISKLLGNDEPKTVEKEKEVEIEPKLATLSKSLICLSLSFPKGQEISPLISIEFLNMLSFTDKPVSFEIVGSFESINIQIVCSVDDSMRVQSHLQAYFPNIIIQEQDAFEIGFDLESEVAIADFGFQDEFMRPVSMAKSFSIDPFTSIIATLENLQMNDVVIFQVIFQGVTAPWSKSIINSVSDGTGGGFFSDSPEMLSCAVNKVSAPLFSSVVRIGTQGNSDERSKYLAMELARSITTISRSEHNCLIPLSNEGYEYENHIRNIFMRTSNRLGMILNSEELVSFVHYPNKTVVSQKLGLQGCKTKPLPQEAINQTYNIGTNSHNGIETQVSINDEARLRHTHIIGVTGVGKSTLIANMMIEDMRLGNGCVLFDPHGDIVEDVLLRIPESRKDDVIIIDPSDSEFSIGFNLLGAKTDVEKIVLSSDLVSAFKRHATAWGDNMTAVLSNAINAFLESSKGGTIIELKRFLLEEKFREQFLESVEDQSIHYYWQYEYPMVKKGIAPLLTRIDTFLRPKLIRYMLAQKSGIDFKECIEQKKIVLIKLSQGLIGEDNSYLLGSLFLSKFNQVALSRQALNKNERHPFYIYLDEFQNFITPSIISILSGARKYGLGLILAHQELGQIDDAKTLNSVISNPNIRICFRLGDNDAKKLESGFSFFEQDDLQSLNVGQAIMRIGSSKNDFNITTNPLPEIEINTSEIIRESIIQNTRNKFAKPKEEIKELLDSLLPKAKFKKRGKKIVLKQQQEPERKTIEVEVDNKPDKENKNVFIPEEEKQKLIEQEETSTRNREHSYIQSMIKKLGQERGYLTTIEKGTKEGGRIDVTLEKEAVMIACEISVTNTVEYEIKNIKKCLSNGYLPVLIISKNKKHLNNIKRLAKKELSKTDFTYLHFIQPEDVAKILDSLEINVSPQREIIKGFRVTTEFEKDLKYDPKKIRKDIAKLLFKKK